MTAGEQQWECARCGETGTGGVGSCPSCGSEELGPATPTLGKWLGTFEGIRLRGESEDSGPILELHGSESMAAVEVSEDVVDPLTETAAEINMEVS